jgi:hypothetical protein
MGYIDHNGKVNIPLKYSQAWDFSDGLGVVCSDECVYIDRSGAVVLNGVRAWWPFSDGLAVRGLEAPQAYIDKSGRVVAQYSLDRR